MPVIITQNNYGKCSVRVLKVKRNKDIHEIKELTVGIQLEGDFESIHTEGDNTKCLPTDTMKNTVYVLAKEHDVNSIEEFGVYLAKYFLGNNSQVSKVTIEVEEKLWQRMSLKSKGSDKFAAHPHSFVSTGNEKRLAKVVQSNSTNLIQSGITDLLVLKTTQSGFEKYIKDKYTTLKETSDRVFSTNIKENWICSSHDVNFNNVFNEVRDITLETFAGHDSLSVQHTLYDIGKNILDKVHDIKDISLSMPNKHYLLYNLEQFGIKNENEIFMPTDEPFGLIEATLQRQ